MFTFYAHDFARLSSGPLPRVNTNNKTAKNIKQQKMK